MSFGTMSRLALVLALLWCGPSALALEVVAESQRQWTGVAVTQEGRIFVNFPRWSQDVAQSVAELRPDGSLAPYPNQTWNEWSPYDSARDRFVCVQSVTVDRANRLWILDPGNPMFRGVIPGAAKLLQVDLETNTVVQKIYFDLDVAPAESYLNDVRVDPEREFAYLTDSGAGALVVLDLNTRRARRVLANHPSTRSEGVTLTIGGEPWLRPNGDVPDVHADGIALDHQGEYVYFQALTGRTLYRIATNHLRDATLSEEELGELVERLAESGASDGLLYGGEGKVYLSSLELDAVRVYMPDGAIQTVAQDPRIAWPDSFAAGPDGSIYFTTAQIHLGERRTEPYRIFRLRPGH